MPVSFDLAKIEEAEELSELRRKVWATTYRGIYPDAMMDAFDYAFHHERNRMFIRSDVFQVYFIVEDGNKIGYLILHKRDLLHLQSLYLLKESQGKGIGTQAFAFVRQYGRDHGYRRFTLTCHPDNAGAMAFYTKMGGVVIRRDIGHERNEENGVVFEFSV